MTQEEKQLLLKDLCARFPYGVKVWYPNGTGVISTVKGIVDDVCYFNKNPIHDNFCHIETVKPYLRSMSDMTKEERALYFAIDEASVTCVDWLNAHHFDYRGLIPMGLALEAPEEMYK
jgi:hypothetical protein